MSSSAFTAIPIASLKLPQSNSAFFVYGFLTNSDKFNEPRLQHASFFSGCSPPYIIWLQITFQIILGLSHTLLSPTRLVSQAVFKLAPCRCLSQLPSQSE